MLVRRKLTKFIRLADFHVRDTMLSLALSSLAVMSEWVNPTVVDEPYIRYKEEVAQAGSGGLASLLLLKSVARPAVRPDAEP